MSETKSGEPPLAKLVLSGEGQQAAEQIADGIFMVRDISNAYLINTGDGDVLVNTGFLTSGARNKALFAPHRTGPLRAIILTQSHADHFGAIEAFLEPDTKIIVQADFAQNKQDMLFLQPHFGIRTRKLWGSTLKQSGPPPKMPEFTPNTIVEKFLALEIGGKNFELISTPDGETTDSLTVWLPDEKTVFTGNQFGPVFLSMPFLCTLRGDKQRLSRNYLKSLDHIRSLGAERLITGHGEPIQGAEKIRADLTKMYDCVAWIRDYTWAGMNARKDVHTLMREIEVPEEIKIGEYHGKISWAVKSIWEEYSGWFHYDSTTSLYGVPRSSIDADLAELAGGADALAARARAKLAQGKPLEAIHLIDIALGAEPGCTAALEVKRDALKKLLEKSGETNLSETMWLRSEIEETGKKLSN